MSSGERDSLNYGFPYLLPCLFAVISRQWLVRIWWKFHTRGEKPCRFQIWCQNRCPRHPEPDNLMVCMGCFGPCNSHAHCFSDIWFCTRSLHFSNDLWPSFWGAAASFDTSIIWIWLAVGRAIVLTHSQLKGADIQKPSICFRSV